MTDGDDHQPTATTLWAPDSLPQFEDVEFRALTTHEYRSTFQPAASQCKGWEDAPNPKTPSSLGDRGTTAMVGAYGDLIQFGTYTGRGRSGLFTADHAATSEPYMVWTRTDILQSWSDRADLDGNSYGLRVYEQLPFSEDGEDGGQSRLYPPLELPRLQFVNYRWPRFEPTTTSRVTVANQWMVHDGLVLQRISFVNTSKEDVSLKLQIPLGNNVMWIRDLEHLDDGYDFNESDNNHHQQFGPHGYSWVLTRKIEAPLPLPLPGDTAKDETGGVTNDDQSQAQLDQQKGSIAVVLSVMENGQLIRLDTTQHNGNEHSFTWIHCLKGVDAENGPAEGQTQPFSDSSLEVTVAYKMMLLSDEQNHWKNFLIPAQAMDVGGILSAQPFNDSLQISTLVEATDKKDHASGGSGGSGGEGASGLSSKKHDEAPETEGLPDQHQPSGLPEKARNSSHHIEFAVRRQLEHILSTCSIPLKPPRMEEDGTPEDYWANDSFDIPVALTCGDMSFHRIIASASFFAFHFLVEIAKRLQKSRHVEDEYARSLLTRITSVCRGHLTWLRRAERPSPKELFVANYWVTGKVINSKGSASWVADDHLTDTAFHIIKADACAELDFDETKLPDFSDVCYSWLKELEKQDRRKCFAWPHAYEGDVNIFRLDDHVWIWRALKAMSQTRLESSLQDDEAGRELMRKFAHRDVQRQVLRRFTTLHDVSGKRMLAVTRSCRETRFLLHARDTVLFYAVEWELLLLDNSADTSSKDLWTSTMKAQHYHDENDEVHWDNALRYALAVLMGSKGHRINQQTPPSLVRKSIITLLKSSSPSGLFAGQLDKANKKPVLFYRESDRDFHFHATFEIPYLLLASAKDITKGSSSSAGAKEETESRPTIRESGRTDTGDSIQVMAAAKQQALRAEASSSLPAAAPAAAAGADLSSSWEMGVVGKSKSVQNPGVFKKLMPFNHLIDSTNIAEVEEEWLYNYPAFFPNDERRTVDDVHQSIADSILESVYPHEWLKTWLVDHPDTAAAVMEAHNEVREWLCQYVTDAAEYRELLAKVLLKESGLRLAFRQVLDKPLSFENQVILETGKLPEAENAKQPSSTSTSSHPLAVADTRPVQAADADADAADAVQPPGSVREGRESRRSTSARSRRTSSSSSSSSPSPSSVAAAQAIQDPCVRAIFRLLRPWKIMRRLRFVLASDLGALVRSARNFPEFRVLISQALEHGDKLLGRVILGNEELRRVLVEAASNRAALDARVVRRAMTSYLSRMGPGSVSGSRAGTSQYLFDEHMASWIVDIGKKKSLGKRSKDEEDSPYSQYPELAPLSSWSRPSSGGPFRHLLGMNKLLWTAHLEAPRTVGKAKKRFIWLPHANLDTALICHLGSPDVEQGSMGLFFDRHVNYELHFFDDTTPHMNTWETEMHLSFYQMASPEPARPTDMLTLYEEPLPGHEGGKITKASMGFRIFGDFFDRYWTCHAVEHVPGVGASRALDLPFDRNAGKGRAWAQRKMLELFLFERIVTMVVESTRDIYERMRTELGVRKGAMSLVDLSSDDYFLSSGHWQECQQTLQAVEDQLGHVSTVVAKWESREKDRGLEKPRWTRNDERKYRGDIKKRLSSSNGKVRDMHRLQADIRTLRELLVSRQDQIRNDLSLRGAENIRFFTYVTVVFLPLGFASSIFSMSEIPSGSLIGSMAACAAVAFLVTVVALINAETLGGATGKVSRHIAHFSQLIRGRSWLVRKRREARTARFKSHGSGSGGGGGGGGGGGVDTGELRGAPHKPRSRNPTRNTRWHARFWLMYVLVELPAQRVGLAYGAMKEQRWTWATCLNMMLALCLLPFCIMVWLVRVAVYNATDLVRLLWHDVVSHLQPRQGPEKDPFYGLMGLLLITDATLRPLKVKLDEKKLNGKLNGKPKVGTEPEKPKPVETTEEKTGDAV